MDAYGQKPVIDRTCPKTVCYAHKGGTYDLPVECTNCGLHVVSRWTRGHEFQYRGGECPRCGCQIWARRYVGSGSIRPEW